MSTDTASRRNFEITEDWTVVFLGFIVITFSLIVVAIPPPSFSWAGGADITGKVFSAKNLISLFCQLAVVVVVGTIATFLTRKSVRSFAGMIPVIFVITLLAQFLAGNKDVKSLNLEAVIFSLLLGLFIGNVFRLPDWFRSALSTELLVKIGLVLLGTSVLFTDILQAGALGLVQALVVVLSVWYFAYWICRKFRLDEELSLMLSSAVSICGVSAAIATAGAIKGDPKKLSYIISLVLVTAIPMMIFMPYVAKYYGWSEEVTGAWLGGTIDTTGAVVASGTLVGETALKTSTIVKFSQNVLLGLAAFAISVYWALGDRAGNTASAAKPTAGVIWERFPKFVLGFIAASVLFSFFISAEAASQVKDSLKSLQGLFFALAFTSIGLETRLADLTGSIGWKPLVAFLIAQAFNIVVTLVVAFALFG